MPAIILQFLPYLFEAAKSVPQILDYIRKTRQTLQATGEWSQETEDAFTAELDALEANPPPWWKPENK